jgi:ATP-dependent protease HslVU (ClpYQ) peptidase subunit
MDLARHGMQTFVCMETGKKVVAHADRIRTGYRKAIDDHIERLRDLSARRKVDYALARTDTHYFTLFDHLAR